MTREGDLSRSAIMLLAFGGPRSLDEVALFMEQLMGKKPSSEQIEGLQQRYQAIGGASPLPETTMRQARALEKALKKTGRPLPVFVGMRYGHPLIAETLEEIRKRGISRIILVSLSPYRSAFSSEGYYDEVKRIVAAGMKAWSSLRLMTGMPILLLCAAWAAKIAEAIGRMGARKTRYLWSSRPTACPRRLPQVSPMSGNWRRRSRESSASPAQCAGAWPFRAGAGEEACGSVLSPRRASKGLPQRAIKKSSSAPSALSRPPGDPLRPRHRTQGMGG